MSDSSLAGPPVDLGAIGREPVEVLGLDRIPVPDPDRRPQAMPDRMTRPTVDGDDQRGRIGPPRPGVIDPGAGSHIAVG